MEDVYKVLLRVRYGCADGALDISSDSKIRGSLVYDRGDTLGM